MFEAVIFDFDGVILDSEPIHYEAFCYVLKDIGHRDSNIGGWDENRWDIECTDFDDESFNRVVGDQLDKILEKIEDSDDFVDVYK